MRDERVRIRRPSCQHKSHGSWSFVFNSALEFSRYNLGPFFRVREVCLKELKFYVDVLSVANFGVRLILSVVIIMIHLLNKLYRIHHHYQIFIILSSFIFYTHKRYLNFVYLFFDCPIQLQKLGL